MVEAFVNQIVDAVEAESVRRVREAGLAGVIIGRAIYEGKFRLRSVLIQET